MKREIMVGQGHQAYQVFQESEASVDYMVYQAPKASPDPQVLTSTETLGSQALLEREVTRERPIHFQVL